MSALPPRATRRIGFFVSSISIYPVFDPAILNIQYRTGNNECRSRAAQRGRHFEVGAVSGPTSVFEIPCSVFCGSLFTEK
jgi:hypothetical protein